MRHTLHVAYIRICDSCAVVPFFCYAQFEFGLSLGRLQQEEEERRQEEEERKKKEDTERRKVERLERRAQLKREGKLLTGKAKKEAERLAAVREQILKQAGLDAPNGERQPLLAMSCGLPAAVVQSTF